MKRLRFFLLSMFLLVGTLAASSCGDDDDDDTNPSTTPSTPEKTKTFIGPKCGFCLGFTSDGVSPDQIYFRSGGYPVRAVRCK